MKKIIILLGIAISMYVLSESNKDEGRTEEEQQILDEYRYGDEDAASKSKSAEVTYYVSEEELKEMEKKAAENNRKGERLVSDLTVDELMFLIKQTIRRCQTTAQYATTAMDGHKSFAKLPEHATRKHYIICN